MKLADSRQGQEKPMGQGAEMQMSKTQQEKERKRNAQAEILLEHVDIIGNDFWDKSPSILK